MKTFKEIIQEAKSRNKKSFPDSMTRHYPDTADGAKDIITNTSSHKLSNNVEHIPDPNTPKTWLTLDHGKKKAFVTYHTGHHHLSGPFSSEFEEHDYADAKKYSRK